jgi:hypothetical protein
MVSEEETAEKRVFEWKLAENWHFWAQLAFQRQRIVTLEQQTAQKAYKRQSFPFLQKRT